MNSIERLISSLISKDKAHPVVVEIDGDIPPEIVDHIQNIVRKVRQAHPQQTITIPLASYAELLRAKAQLDVIKAMHFKATYGMENLLISMFGEKQQREAIQLKEEGAPDA